MPVRNFVVAEGGDDHDTTLVTVSALLVEATPSELESFRVEGLEVVKLNDSAVGFSAFMMTEEGPVVTVHLAHPYSLSDRISIENWLRQHALVRRITFEEDVSDKREGRQR